MTRRRPSTLSVSCPVCGARAGFPCRAIGNLALDHPTSHALRFHKAGSSQKAEALAARAKRRLKREDERDA